MNRLGANAGEGQPSALMGRQFIAQSQDLAHERLQSSILDMFRNPTLVPKTVEAEGFISANLLRQPPSISVDCLQRPAESTRLLMHSNRFKTDLIFLAFFHRRQLLPNDIGRNLSDIQNSFRCPCSFLVYNVPADIQ